MNHFQPDATEHRRPGRSQLENALLSHDLRSALSRVVSGSQALEQGTLPETAASYIAQIRSAAHYMADLLNTADPTIPAAENTDLPLALARLEAIWKPAVAEKGLEIYFNTPAQYPGTLPLPDIDFMRIMNNLIGNALKYSTSGTIFINLSTPVPHSLLIEISDNGPGFGDEMHPRVFTLHGRPDSPKAEGSGFGLYICKDLMEKSGGSITAENRPTGGAKISLRFPITAKSNPSPPPNALPDLSHLDILLAEDNPTNQLVATRMLEKMNANVATVPDGVEAMTVFAQRTFNLGLIDIEMPRKSGLEVIREIRASGCTPDEMKLVALTAYVLPEHKARIMDAGADSIIAKPLTDIAAFGQAILHATGPRPSVAASPAKANPDAAIDLDTYKELQGIIGAESMRELLQKVQADMADVSTGIQDGVARHDVVPIRAKTHILISVAGAIGAVNLQHIAEALNATAKTEEWAKIKPEAERCQKGLADVLHFINQELNPSQDIS